MASLNKRLLDWKKTDFCTTGFNLPCSNTIQTWRHLPSFEEEYLGFVVSAMDYCSLCWLDQFQDAKKKWSDACKFHNLSKCLCRCLQVAGRGGSVAVWLAWFKISLQLMFCTKQSFGLRAMSTFPFAISVSLVSLSRLTLPRSMYRENPDQRLRPRIKRSPLSGISDSVEL